MTVNKNGQKSKVIMVALFVLLIGFTILSAACDNGTTSGFDNGNSKSPFQGVWETMPNCYEEFRGNSYTSFDGNKGIIEWSGTSINGTITFNWLTGNLAGQSFTSTYNFVTPDEFYLGDSTIAWKRKSY